MLRTITLFLCFMLTATATVAQTYNMSSTTVTTCSGTFYDSGGAAGSYSNSQNLTMTFNSGSSARVSVSFSSFATEANNDFLWVYDGPSTAYPLIATYSGSNSPGVITSTGSSLTFRFTSDGSTVASGWDATISCTGTALTTYPLSSGTVTACSGTVFDDGGPNVNYSSSIIGTTQTFCSGTTDRLQFTFLRPYSSLSFGDTLFIYDGSSTAAPLLFIHVANSSFEDFISSGTCVTFRFKSDATTTTAGWAGQFQCTSASPTAPVFNMSGGTRFVCNGTFYDTGGPSGSYLNGENRSQTFASYNGERISVNFSLFATENNNDFLWVYDGPSTAYPLIATFTGSNSPGVITSTGTSLTFRFTSDGSTTSSGWSASFSCAGPILNVYPLTSGTVTACSGTVFDNGGPNVNYSSSIIGTTQTFCSGTTDRLQFTFLRPYSSLGAGDTLFIYDGSSTAAPLLFIHVANSSFEDFISSGTCVTFRFKSDATTTTAGWAGQFQCTSASPTAPVFNMSGGTRFVCSGTFYDTGGPSGSYLNGENRTQTFASYNGERISVNFSLFATENNNDFLWVYDGPSTAYPLIATFTGSNSPGVITSTGTSLTFRFTSDGSTTSSGWSASFSCAGPILNVYPLTSGTVTACSGTVFDNGGPNVNYSSSIIGTTQTFCSGTTDRLQFTFLRPYSSLGAGDTLFIYDGSSTAAPLLFIHVANSSFEDFISSGTCVTFRFKSDATTTTAGWAGQFQCTSASPTAPVFNMSGGTRFVCSGTFYDTGGPSGSYLNGENRSQTFASYNGERISVNFSLFATENNNDFLWVYDGPSTAYPLIATFTGSNSPGVITSTGTSLTFRFTSDGSVTSSGWTASFSCAGPILNVYPLTSGTVTACSGTVFDNGGPNVNYSSSIIGTTQTFCSGTTDRLQFTFLRPYSSLGAGDTLFIYDGSSTAAPLLFIHVANSSFEDFISSGTCVTFRFKSDATTTTAGWAGQFQCTSASPTAPVFNMSAGTRFVCSGTFYDTGGPSGSYLNGENRSQTFASYNGERISVNFSLFATENNNDFLWVYDGPSTAYPLIATFTGSNSPGVITSTGTSLTFRFTSDGSVTSSGWTASFSCAGPVLPEYPLTTGTITTCGGVFYDKGGALGNYPNNENRVMTFTSANGQYLKFDFNPNHFNMAAGDSLFVYDGTSTVSPLYAVLTGNVSPGSIVSNTSSFTFRFVSNGTTNNIGWQALISCVATPDLNPQISMTAGIRYTCGGNFYDVGGASGSYQNNENRTMSFYSNSGCGIRFTFNSFNLASGDILYVHDGPSISAPIIATLTGSTLPSPVQSTGNVLTFRFTSNSSTVSSGWNATISCPNQPLATITASGPLALCPGDSVVLTAAPNASYLWNTGATTQSITANTAGSYWVTVTNANSCTAVSNIISVTVTNSTSAGIAASGPLTFCQGGSVTLTASGGSSYVWSNNATGSTLNVTQSGNYFAIASNGSCVDTSSVISVTVNPLPVVTLTLPQDSFCSNQPSASVLSGGSPAGGVWSGPGVSGNLFTPATAGPGLHTIAYTYTDTNACSNVATEVVFVDVCNGVTTATPDAFAVYPNPAHNVVIIRLGEGHQVKTIALYDMTGRLLMQEAVNNRTQLELSLSGLESGVYLIEAGHKQVKLIKE